MNPDGSKFYHNGTDVCRIDVPSGPSHASRYAAYKCFEQRKSVPNQGYYGALAADTGIQYVAVRAMSNCRQTKDEDDRHWAASSIISS